MGRAPVAHEHLAQIGPPLQDELSAHILALNHKSFDQGHDLIGEDYSKLVPEDKRTPEQNEHHQRVTGLMELAAGLTGEAHQLLTEQQKITGSEEPVSAIEVLHTAKALALDGIAAAKARGDDEAIKVGMRGFLTLGLLGDRDVSDDTATAPQDAREVVRRGLAVELVAGLDDLRGVVAMSSTSQGRATESRERFLRGGDDLLSIACDRDVSSGVALEPQQKQERMGNLLGPDLMALATARTAEGKTEEATALALQSLERLQYVQTKETVEVLRTARDMCIDPETRQPTAEFTQRVDTLRVARMAGSHYRINNSDALVLDEAIVELVKHEELDMAYALISSSRHELSTTTSDEGNLDRVIRWDESISDAEKTRITGVITQLHLQKQSEFRQALIASGADKSTVDALLTRTIDPDAAVAVSPEFWQSYSSMPYQLRDLVVGKYTGNTAEAASVVLKLFENGVIDVRVAQSVMEAVRTKSDDMPDDYIESIGRMYGFIKKSIEEGSLDKWSGFDNEMQLIISMFADPEMALQLAARMYGKDALYRLRDIKNLFPSERVIKPEVAAGLVELQNKFGKVCRVQDLISHATHETIATAMQIDPQKLTELMIKLGGSEKFIGDTPPSLQYSKMLELLKMSTDPQLLLEKLSAIDDEYMDLVKASYGTYGNITMRELLLSSAALGDATTTQRIKAIFKSGLSDFLAKDGVDDALKLSLSHELLRDGGDLSLVRALSLTHEIFGDFMNIQGLRLVSDVQEGHELPQEVRSLGITKSGEAGVNQLKTALIKFAEGIYETGEMPVHQIIRNPFLLHYAKQLVRYDSSQYGSRSDESFLATLTDSQRVGAVMRPEYVTGEFQVELLDKLAAEEFAVSQDGIEQWEFYAGVISRAAEIVPSGDTLDWGKFGELLRDIQSSISERGEQMSGGIGKLGERISQLEAKQQDTVNLASQLEKQLASQARLADINYEAVEDFDLEKLTEHIVELAFHKSIAGTGLLQTLLVVTAMIKQFGDGNLPRYPISERQQNLNNPDENLPPTLEDIQEMSDFIGHVANRETWHELFEKIGGQKQVDSLLGIDALESNIERVNQLGTSGTRTFRMMPTRGALMEFSGHIADSCWASKYKSMAEEFPNMTSVVMVQSPRTSSQRLVGSAMLMETTGANGEPLLVIRGLNPIQNTITQVSPESFYNEFTEYAKGIAESLGRKLAIVIDDHSGGSSTNRPSLHAFLTQLRDQSPNAMPRVVLASAADTTFNRYNITNDTYLVA